MFENYDMNARIYGDNVAVVLGKTRVKGTSEGKPFDRVVQFTDTLVAAGRSLAACSRTCFADREVDEGASGQKRSNSADLKFVFGKLPKRAREPPALPRFKIQENKMPDVNSTIRHPALQSMCSKD